MTHDGGYHLLFSHPEMVEDLVTRFVAESWVADLDFARMERVNAKLHADSLDRRDGDLIYRIPLRRGGEIYLYLLLEFQSRSDRFMALRVLVYAGLLYQHLVREGRLAEGGRLPPVFPLVLYNGSDPWRAPLDLRALIALPPDSPLSHWQPDQRYYLLDERSVASVDPADLRSLVEILFALETNRDRALLPPLLTRLGDMLAQPALASLRRAFRSWLSEVWAARVGVTLDANGPASLSEVEVMLAEHVKRWEAELRHEGLLQGRQEGRLEGRQEGRLEGQAEMLRRLIARRFGAVPDWAEQRIVAADPATLEEWGFRLLEARSLEDLFA